jgi:hypothetical protein
MTVPQIGRSPRFDLSLRSKLANVDQQIADLASNNELSAGEKLRLQAYYEGERERLQLKLELPRLRSAVTFAKAKYEFECSSAGREKAHRHAMLILACRVGGAGQGRMDWKDIQEDTEEKQAKVELYTAQHAVARAEKRSRYLQQRNARLKRAMTNLQEISKWSLQESQPAKRAPRRRGHRQPAEVVESAWDKYKHPQKFPWMTTGEVSVCLNVSTKRVYGLTEEGKVIGRGGRISTKSVRQFLKKHLS